MNRKIVINTLSLLALTTSIGANENCNFYGTLGLQYEAVKDEGSANSWGKKDNTFLVGVALGVKKELGYGFGIGAEIGAFSDIGLKKIAQNSQKDADLSQLYLTYTNKNTTVMAGRFAIPEELSPASFSDRTIGVLDNSYEGIAVINKDIDDTTLTFAWLSKYKDFATASAKINGTNNKGLFMLSAVNESIKDTTLTGAAYYVTEAKYYSFWAMGETKVNDIDLGLQAVYTKTAQKGFGIATYAGFKLGDIDTKLTVAYANKGKDALNFGIGSDAFWGDPIDEFSSANKQTLITLEASRELGIGTLSAAIGYNKSNALANNEIAAGIGYEFEVAGVETLVEYKFLRDENKNKVHKINLEAVYKF